MAPSHYLNQCWLVISEVLWHSPKGNLTGGDQAIYPWYEFEITDLRSQTHLQGNNEFDTPLPVMMFAFEAVKSNETWKYLAMNVMKPVLMDCSATRERLMNSHVGLDNKEQSWRGNAEDE